MMNELSSQYMTVPNWNEIEATKLVGEPWHRDEFVVILPTNHGDLLLAIIEIEDCLAVRLSSDPAFRVDYGLLHNQPRAVATQVRALSSGYSVSAQLDDGQQLSVEFASLPLAIKVTSHGQERLCSANDGHFVREHRVPPLAKTEEGWFVSLALGSGDSMFGFGEKWGKLDKRGQLIRSYNHDALGVNAEVSYKNTPFGWSPSGWGLFFHTSAPVLHAVGHPAWSQRSYIGLVEDPCLDLFLFVSDAATEKNNTGADLIGQYSYLTGRAPLPPLWSTGVILSKAYYETAGEILAVAHEVRERDMPCDVITFDGRAWQDTQTRFAFEWDSSRYPEPEKVIAELKRLEFKICVWEYPLISIKHPWFEEFAAKDWLLKDRRTNQAYQYSWDRQAFGQVLTPLPASGIVDFTHPDAYQFWKEAHRDLFELGVDMIKADFGEQVEDDNMLAHNGESGRALHNIYAHLYNRCVFEAASEYSSSGAFLFSRSAWTGSQRFNSQWGGDPQADWEGMIGNIRGGLSWGLSGAPFYATDVGGFYKDRRDDSLYVRWAQAAVFSAHFRLHGIGAREPWSYSEEAAAAVDKALRLRYRLQAYLFEAIRESSRSGLPVQRAMVLAFADDKAAWSFENQFMFGEDLLVVPCFDALGEVEFYLPAGQWCAFDPDAEMPQTVWEGGKVYRSRLALDEILVFTKAGTTIPLSPSSLTRTQTDQPIVEEQWEAKAKQ